MFSLLLGFCHSEKVASLQRKLKMGMLRKISLLYVVYLVAIRAKGSSSANGQKQQKDRQQ